MSVIETFNMLLCLVIFRRLRALRSRSTRSGKRGSADECVVPLVTTLPGRLQFWSAWQGAAQPPALPASRHERRARRGVVVALAAAEHVSVT